MARRGAHEDALAKLLDGRLTGADRTSSGPTTSSRYSCTRRTTIEPSPTADATRFTEPPRTSPTANTPATVVSNRNGRRREPSRWGDGRHRVGPGEHEAVLVDGDLVAEPAGVRLGADEHEHRPGVDPLAARRSGCSPPRPAGGTRSPSRRRTSLSRRISTPGIRCSRSTRYRDMLCAEVGLPHHQPHPRRPGGEEHRSLAGRVAATDHDDRLADAEMGLHQSRRVVDARRLEPLDVRHGEAPVADSGGDDHGPRRHRRPVAQAHGVEAVLTGRGRRPRPGRTGRPRTSRPGAPPARRARPRTARPGTRGSSRSASRGRPDPPWRCCRAAIVARPSEAPYTAAASPAGPAADDQQVVPVSPRLRHRQADHPGQLGVARVAQDAVLAPDRRPASPPA